MTSVKIFEHVTLGISIIELVLKNEKDNNMKFSFAKCYALIRKLTNCVVNLETIYVVK
jgi:hypothetical protein